jgi:excisionase family DNA binding protein
MAITLARLLTIREVASAANVSEWTVRKEIAEGRLRARRIGRCVRILDEDGDHWMRAGDEP